MEIRTFLSSWYGEGIFHTGVSSPAFRKEKGSQSTLLASAGFQVALTQNNLMSNWQIWAYPATFHHPASSEQNRNWKLVPLTSSLQ